MGIQYYIMAAKSPASQPEGVMGGGGYLSTPKMYTTAAAWHTSSRMKFITKNKPISNQLRFFLRI